MRDWYKKKEGEEIHEAFEYLQRFATVCQNLGHPVLLITLTLAREKGNVSRRNLSKYLKCYNIGLMAKEVL